MIKFNQLLWVSLSLLFFTACVADDEPEPSCSEAGIFEVPAISMIVDSLLISDANNGTFWVCDGGVLSLSGSFNTVLVSKGGFLELNGNDNMAYVLGEAEVVSNGDDQMLWLNGDSKATINGDGNYLNYYRTGMLLEYGERTVVDDLCGNVELDFSKAPGGGCQQ